MPAVLILLLKLDCTVPNEAGLPVVAMPDETEEENRRRRKRDLADFVSLKAGS